MKVVEIKELTDAVDSNITSEKKRYAMRLIRIHKSRIAVAETMLKVAQDRLADAKANLKELLDGLKAF